MNNHLMALEATPTTEQSTLGKMLSQRWLGMIILILFNLGVYGRGLPNGFVAEDFNMMAVSTLPWSGLWQMVTTEARIKPLPIFLNKGLYTLFGMDPTGYHLVNLLLHAICTWCVMRLATLLSGKSQVGWIAGLLFAVYPRHHQTVLWLAANQFIIATLLGLVAFLCFHSYLLGNKRHFYLLTWGTLFLALITNEIGAVFLFLLPFWEWVVNRSLPGQASSSLRGERPWLKYWPLLILLFAFLWLTFGDGRLNKLSLNQSYHFTGLGIEQVKTGASYLVYLLFPHFALRSLDVTPGTVALAGLAVLGLVAALKAGSAQVRFLVLWAVTALVPYVFFVPFGNADRYFYGAAAALSILLVLTGQRLYVGWRVPLRLKQGLVFFLLIVYLASSVALIQQRIDEWRRAGEIAGDLVKQVQGLYPHPSAGTEMLFVNLPDQHGQAYVFKGGGVGGALYLAYHSEGQSPPKAYQTYDPVTLSFLRTAEPKTEYLSEPMVFLYQDGILLDKSKVVDRIEVLQKETWFR
jgi:hypothetical protein